MARAAKEDPDIPESDRLEGFPHPRETTDLVGHEAAERQFLESYRSGKNHHAWIIGGPRGIGKATLAYRAARFVLRYSSDDLEAMDNHDSLYVPAEEPVCHRIAARAHSDLLVLNRPWDSKNKKLKTVVSVDEVRRTVRFFGRTAGEGGWRICIVDSADEMNANAANALLKILEEPPPKVLFFLVSHIPGRLLPTIRSRCRRLDLSPLSQNDCTKVMAGLVGDGQSADDIAVAARLGEGSVGQGLKLLEGGGIAIYRQMLTLLDTLPNVDVKRLNQFTDKIAPRTAAAEYDLFCDLILKWIARMVRAVSTGDFASVPQNEADLMARLANRHSAAHWADAWEKINRSLMRANALNLDRKQTVAVVFYELEQTLKAAQAA